MLAPPGLTECAFLSEVNAFQAVHLTGCHGTCGSTASFHNKPMHVVVRQARSDDDDPLVP